MDRLGRVPPGSQRSSPGLLSISPVSSPALASAAPTFTRLIDAQRPAAEIGAVERRYGSIGVVLFHLDERKSAKPAGLAVSHPGQLVNGTILLEQFMDFVFGCAEGNTADVDFFDMTSYSLPKLCAQRAGRPGDLPARPPVSPSPWRSWF